MNRFSTRITMARKRVVLNHKSVCEIQSLAPTFAGIMRRGVKSQLSNEVALRFGVDAKTIRDIWNRKSWKGFNHHKHNENAEQQRIADSFLSDDNLENTSIQWTQSPSMKDLLEIGD